MKKRKKLYTAIVLLLVMILLVAVNCIKICSVNPHVAEDVYEWVLTQYNTEDVDICILDYQYVTGASWFVERSTNKAIENTYICLNTICNPRLLKLNEEFELDYFSKFVVVIDKNVTKATIDDEEVYILKAKDITITNIYYQNDGGDDLRFYHLTFAGKLKSVLAFFVPKFRLQL